MTKLSFNKNRLPSGIVRRLSSKVSVQGFSKSKNYSRQISLITQKGQNIFYVMIQYMYYVMPTSAIH